MHAFVDESQRGPYLVVAAVLIPRDLVQVRGALRGMLLPGQRRLHFSSERPQRRRVLLGQMSDLPIQAWVYAAEGKERVARARALESLLADLGSAGARRLVIECREPSQDAADRRLIAQAIRAGIAPAGLSYDHLRAHEEPVLWVADAVAWAVGARGAWAQRTEAIVNLHRIIPL
jgi:hypothetical protein